MVVVADREATGARATRDEIVQAGGGGLGVTCDVSDSKAVARLIEHTKSTYGRIDILVHAAGICPRKPFLDMTDEDWRSVLNVNLDSTFYVTRDVAKVMAEQRAGTMILMTSDRGVHGSINYAHYAASKGGMLALTKSLALHRVKRDEREVCIDGGRREAKREYRRERGRARDQHIDDVDA